MITDIEILMLCNELSLQSPEINKSISIDSSRQNLIRSYSEKSLSKQNIILIHG